MNKIIHYEPTIFSGDSIHVDDVDGSVIASAIELLLVVAELVADLVVDCDEVEPDDLLAGPGEAPHSPGGVQPRRPGSPVLSQVLHAGPESARRGIH